LKDLIFLSGEFFEFEIPKEKQFLFKYFNTPLEQSFIKYFFCFENFETFPDDTGFCCQQRWLKLLKKRLDKLLIAQKDAKEQFDFESLKRLETGEYKLKSL